MRDAPRYPRDFHGYGSTPPDAKWPNKARIAVQIVINYEEGGENSLLHGDSGSEAFLSEIVGATSWPGQRHWNMESLYDYGARAGFWRLHRVFTERRIPVTVYGVATALARAPAQVAAMAGAGWEIASHGLKWIEYKDVSEDEERTHLNAAITLHEQVVGERPRGWYLGRCSMNTVRLVAEEGGFDYVSDVYNDDLPYWSELGGRTQLMIPYTLDANDMRFATAQGFNTGDHFYSYLKDTFDCLYAEGGRMMSVGLHCRLAGRPGRAIGLMKFLDYAAEHDGVWFARRIDIAHHWKQAHPPAASTRPTRMTSEEFTSTFGGIFEHSAWIAERTHALELGPAHDTAAGLHNAMCRVFRSASPEEREQVLKAHPDLAGKLAKAKRLTDESTAEQASAGLDALTDAERDAFERLNASYTEKFGFPFIVAVRDHEKQGILNLFEKRLAHDRDTEFLEACRQVERIAELRLSEVLP